jgi:hypothetical protein
MSLCRDACCSAQGLVACTCTHPELMNTTHVAHGFLAWRTDAQAGKAEVATCCCVQEKEQLQQSLKQEGVPEQQQQLTATLVKQIERQIAKLQRMLTKKQHELSQLKQPISISDIIANEC